MGKNSAPDTQTVINKTELPPWVTKAGEDLYKQTTAKAQQLPLPYMGSMIPAQNADTLNAYQMTRDAAGLALPGMATAAAGSARAAAFNPASVSSQNFLQGNIGAYMSPFTQNVEDRALAAIDKQRLNALNETGDQALSRGAFGGSRQAIREGVTNAEAAGKAGEVSAQLRQQAFENAQGMMTADMNRNLQAAQSNQQAGIAGAQVNNQGGIGLANISQGLQQSALQGAAALEGTGAAQRAYDSTVLQQDAMRYEQLRQYPFEVIGKQLQAIGAVPYGQSSSTTGPATQQGQNFGMSALGGLSSGLGLASALGGTTALGMGGTAGLGGMGMLLGLLSDERTKTNIEKVGKDADTGLTLYAYDYKADVKAAKKSGKPMGPKRVGPMAQEIEKKFPGMTREVDGKLTIPGGLGFGRLKVA